MFGYVTVYKPELKIKEYDIYKGIYCTLCKKMQSEYGIFSRFLLSYDATFYVLYRMGVTDSQTESVKSHCSFSPCKKCLKINSDEEIFKKAAAITVILSYFKLCDNITDGNSFKRILCKIIKPYFNYICKKAKKKYPDVFNVVKKYMDEQLAAETDFQSIDACADPSGNILGYILSDGDVDSASFKIGYHLGRTVYFLDAFDDYEKDIKSNSFNPFKGTNNITDDAEFALNMTLGEIAEYCKSVKFYRFKNIIFNILFMGLNDRKRKTAMKKRGEEDE